MAFYHVGYDLTARARQLQADVQQLIRQATEQAAAIVEAGTPKGREEASPLMAPYLAQHGYDGQKGWVGPLAQLKIDESVSGKGHIAAFVAWYRQAYPERPSPRPKTKEAAWVALTEHQKSELRKARLGGQYGGPYPPPVYFAAVNEGKVPGGVRSHAGFVADMQEQVRAMVEGLVSNARL